MSLTLSIDVMGGDHGPSVVIPAVVRALKLYPKTHFILVGDKDVISSSLNEHNVQDDERLTIHHASQQVTMGESAAVALRTKKDSSMRVALNQRRFCGRLCQCG